MSNLPSFPIPSLPKEQAAAEPKTGRGRKVVEKGLLLGATGGGVGAAILAWNPTGSLKGDAAGIFYLAAAGVISASGYLALKYTQRVLNDLSCKAAKGVTKTGATLIDRLTDRAVTFINNKLTTNPKIDQPSPATAKIIEEYHKGASDTKLVNMLAAFSGTNMPVDYEYVFNATLPAKDVLMEASAKDTPLLKQALSRPGFLYELIETRNVPIETMNRAYAALLAHLPDTPGQPCPENYSEVMSYFDFCGADPKLGLASFSNDPDIQSLLIRDSQLCARIGAVTDIQALRDHGATAEVNATPEIVAREGASQAGVPAEEKFPAKPAVDLVDMASAKQNPLSSPPAARALAFTSSEAMKAHNLRLRKIPLTQVMAHIYPDLVPKRSADIRIQESTYELETGRVLKITGNSFVMVGPDIDPQQPKSGRGAIDLYCSVLDVPARTAINHLTEMEEQEMAKQHAVRPKTEDISKAKLAAHRTPDMTHVV